MQRQLDELSTSYPKPSYSAVVRCHTAAAFAPKAASRGEWDLWPAATRQQGTGHGVRGGTAGSSMVHAWSHSPRHLPRGPRLAYAAGHQGLCSGRMRKWGWGRSSMAGVEILGYLWNCGQPKIHRVALIPPFFKHLYFSGVVSEKCLCRAESTDMRW